MVDQGGDFSFFWSIHVRIDVRMEISTSTRPMTSKFGKQVHPEELTQRKSNQAGAGDIIMWISETYVHYQIGYGDQT